LDHKKAEPERIDAFELWCWRRLLRILCTARSNQSILKERAYVSFIEVIWGKVWQFFAVKCSSEHKEEIFLSFSLKIYIYIFIGV